MDTGCNDFCPCGSGNSYERCCLVQPEPLLDLLGYRINNAFDSLIEKLLLFAKTRIGELSFVLAVDEFFFWPDYDEVPESMDDFMPVALPWYLFNWIYDPDVIDEHVDIPAGQTIAEIYLAENHNQLNQLQMQLIHGAVRNPFSFHEVMASEPGYGFTLKDIFTGRQTKVMEKQEVKMAQAGDILMGRIVTIDHISIFVGCSPMIIRPSWKLPIIKMRKNMNRLFLEVTDNILLDYDMEIRALFLGIHEMETRPPKAAHSCSYNTLFQNLSYRIDDPQAAFEKLCSLAQAPQTYEALRKTAVLDDNGRIMTAEIPWLSAASKAGQEQQNSMLGLLIIDQNSLKVKVNSKTLVQSISEEITTRLGNSAQYLGSVPQAMEQEIEDLDKDGVSCSYSRLAMHRELIQKPEMRRELGHMISKHWKSWVDEKQPALNGDTPRQAVKTIDGRESVEALLMEAQREMENNEIPQWYETDPFEEVRRVLKLDKPLKNKNKSEPTNGQDYAVSEIKSIIESFSKHYLEDRVKNCSMLLCQRLEKGDEFTLNYSRPEIWAAIIIYAIAQLNFLFDSKNQAHIKKSDLFDELGIKPAIISKKALQIRKDCGIEFGDPSYTLPEIIKMFNFVETSDEYTLPGAKTNKSASADDYK
ncbi:MAG: DUF2384 domain-containing protein [Desulfobacteraceae bacterium]|nr:DUF2384 domain-containing protein [Desulfobacteraceae bacterium]